jgi:hypothetical protein
MRRWIAALTVVVWIVVNTGSGAATATASTFVGRVEGSDAFIAVERDGRKIGGYVCDNGTVSRWIEYAFLRRGRAPLVAGTTGEPLGSVRIAGRSATGTINVGGQDLAFRARRVHGRSAGLYFAVGKQVDQLLVAGWILDPDGTQRGAVSRLDTRTLRPVAPVAAPKLDPRAETVQIGGDTNAPPVDTEPQQLVVINIIAILISLLVPAVQS